MTTATPIRVNRAPVLTLWATVVAERLGHPSDTALTLGQAVASSSARIKARSIGLTRDSDQAAEKRQIELRPQIKPVMLLGREIRLAATEDGELRADNNAKPASASAVQVYLFKAFGTRLAEARAAMEQVAAALQPDEPNRVGFRMYEAFRPDVPVGATGWGAKGELHIERIAAQCQRNKNPGACSAAGAKVKGGTSIRYRPLRALSL